MTPGVGASATASRPARSRRAVVLLTLAAAAMVAVLLGLGTWQVQRLAWKRDLIARVDARVHRPPRPAPGRASWPAIDAERFGYTHVRLTGRYLPERSVRTQAATVLGAGSWLLTPLVTSNGFTVLVNRGFVPPDWREGPAPTGTVTVDGLLRITEPGGGFLRRNDPAAGRWYSRDVAAIAAAGRLPDVAPYFVDADARPGRPETPPVGGLTVVSFPNNHLGYAITWYVLAAMVCAGWVIAMRDERRVRG